MLLWLLIAVALTTWAVQRSTQIGRLAAPPGYDDVVYFNAGLNSLRQLSELGSVDALAALLRDPPRVPFSQFLAAISFAIGGTELYVPYLASFFVPWVALLFTSRFAAGANPAHRLLIGLYVCTIPFLTVSVTQFRPDPFWGIVLGGAVGFLLTERMVGGRVAHLLAAGALFGAACLIKTSTFPVTVAALAASVILAAIADRCAQPDDWSWRAAIESALTVCGTAAMVAFPYYALAWRRIFSYIYVNAVGAHAEVWAIPGDWWYHLRFYSFGPAGATMFGRHLPLLLLLVAAGIAAVWVAAWRVGRRAGEPLVRLVAFTLGVAVLYVLPTIPRHKGPFFGAAFDAGLMFLAVFAISRVVVVVSRRVGGVPAATAALVLLVVAGVLFFRWPLPAARPDELANRTRLYQEVVAALRGLPQTPTLRELWLTTPLSLITPQGLQWMVDREGLAVRVVSDYWEDDVGKLLRRFGRVDLVLAPEERSAYRSQWAHGPAPVEHVQGEILLAIRQHDAVRLIATFQDLGGNKLYLFQRVSTSR